MKLVRDAAVVAPKTEAVLNTGIPAARTEQGGQAPKVFRVSPASTWANRGRDTIANLVETEYWAGAGGDTRTLASLIVVEGRNRETMKTLAERMPPNVLASYPSAEELAAFMIAAESNVRGYLLRMERQMADGITAAVLSIPGANGKFETEEHYFRQGPDGQWKRVIVGSEINRWNEIARRDNMVAPAAKK